MHAWYLSDRMNEPLSPYGRMGRGYGNSQVRCCVIETSSDVEDQRTTGNPSLMSRILRSKKAFVPYADPLRRSYPYVWDSTRYRRSYASASFQPNGVKPLDRVQAVYFGTLPFVNGTCHCGIFLRRFP